MHALVLIEAGYVSYSLVAHQSNYSIVILLKYMKFLMQATTHILFDGWSQLEGNLCSLIATEFF